MKKIAPIAALAFFGMMSFTACKKDYSCKCSATVAGVTADTSISLGKMKKSDAKSKCETYDKDMQTSIEAAKALGITASGSCDVK
ncbi:hypothetical protein [Polluticoccus soli]|uniref:hypothetical protein n=1 Tax=Polluticoccus soli TaxID=3034150 RepID=UPI0023E095B6|nr:hypothetical protein [Flavipsychrobacter sp. JY13-12]